MPRRSHDLEDVEFFFRFFTKPFVSPNWACGYVAIGTALLIMQALFVGTPPAEAEPTSVAAMLRPLQVVWTLRLILPGLAFNVVGLLGFSVCLVRDWREFRS